MTYIGGGWYMEKVLREYLHLKRSKLSKKAQEKEKKKNIISGAMIGNSNYTGTSLNG